MKKYTDTMNIRKDTKLESLLAQRKAPLSEEGIQEVLKELTLHMTSDVQFFCVVFPKEEALSRIEIKANEIEKTDILQGTDEERYFPVFSTLDHLKGWKDTLRKGEFIYVANKEEILDFLVINEKVAAAVLNPGEDDLLLHRMILQNLIQNSKGGEK